MGLTHSDDHARVGVGPTYDAIRAAARELVPLFIAPNTSARSRWGAGMVDVEPVEGGHRVSTIYPVCSAWEKASNSLVQVLTLDELRGDAITLLAYCEAQEQDR